MSRNTDCAARSRVASLGLNGQDEEPAREAVPLPELARNVVSLWYRIPESPRWSDGLRLSTDGPAKSGRIQSDPAGYRVWIRVQSARCGRRSRRRPLATCPRWPRRSSAASSVTNTRRVSTLPGHIPTGGRHHAADGAPFLAQHPPDLAERLAGFPARPHLPCASGPPPDRPCIHRHVASIGRTRPSFWSARQLDPLRRESEIVLRVPLLGRVCENRPTGVRGTHRGIQRSVVLEGRFSAPISARPILAVLKGPASLQRPF